MLFSLQQHRNLETTKSNHVPVLPTSWSVTRLGNLGTFTKGRGGSREDDDATGVACIRYGDLYKLNRPLIRSAATRINKGAASSYTRVRHGDILFALSGESQEDIGKSSVCLISEPTYCGGDTAVLAPSRSIDPEFLSHALTAPYSTSQKGQLGRGDIIVHLSVSSLKRMEVAVPPADEQDAIVKYLAHAHARIDRAIAAKQKLIALLEEQKQAIIHQAVTRGLDPTVPLKDTGIPWLGQVPAHWGVARAKHLFREFDRRSGTGEQRLLSLRAAAGLVYHDEVSSIPIGPATLEKYKMVSPGDLVMNRMRAASGLFAIASAPGLVSPDYSTMNVDASVDAKFYLRLFKTRAAMAEFKKRSTGLGTGEAGFMRLYSDDFGRVPLPQPPLAEQRAITTALDAEFERSAAVVTKASVEIQLLREFRTRLTSDVVTGQVDVREIAATLPELSDDMLADTSNDAEDLLEDIAEESAEGVND